MLDVQILQLTCSSHTCDQNIKQTRDNIGKKICRTLSGAGNVVWQTSGNN